MSTSPPKKNEALPEATELTPAPVHVDDHLEDEEKILDGRPDVNYPALLTKDVPGG